MIVDFISKYCSLTQRLKVRIPRGGKVSISQAPSAEKLPIAGNGKGQRFENNSITSTEVRRLGWVTTTPQHDDPCARIEGTIEVQKSHVR